MFDVVERLHREFGVQLARTQIRVVAQQCCDQLDSVSAAARPELLGSAARQRRARRRRGVAARR
jgi:hypothetical protein